MVLGKYDANRIVDTFATQIVRLRRFPWSTRKLHEQSNQYFLLFKFLTYYMFRTGKQRPLSRKIRMANPARNTLWSLHPERCQ